MMRRSRSVLLAAGIAHFVTWCCALAAHAQYPPNRMASLQSPVLAMPERLPPPNAATPLANELAPDFTPWWQEPLLHQLKRNASPLTMTLDNAVLGTLMHSPQVRVLTDSVLVQRSAIMENQARFDMKSFMETKFVDTSDPVGNLLTTGGAKRFLDQNWNYSGGVRQQTSMGGQLEMAQRFGYQNNNSIFFLPAPQGTSRITLSLTQPLLNGAGKKYNSSLTVLADISTGIARDEMSGDLQALLLDVHRQYWDLYLQRAALLQKRKLQRGALDIQAELNARRDTDVLGNQLVRARAAAATREAATIRYETEVSNAESRLRATLNDPGLIRGGSLELVPVQTPNVGRWPVDLFESLTTALQNRAEINQVAKEIKAACVRADVSKNELLPVLNLVMGTYVTGLEGQADMGQAWVDQFTKGRPSYSTGFTFEVPFGNRAANARMQQRRLELRQTMNQLQITTANIRSDVEIAVREVDTTYREMVSKYHAMAADEAEIQYLTERWRLLPGDQQVAGVVLEDLLDTQERLATAEFGFTNALVAYNISLINLKKVTGTLLEYQEINFGETKVSGLPTMTVEKPPTGSPAPAPQLVPQGPALIEPSARRNVPVERLPSIR